MKVPDSHECVSEAPQRYGNVEGKKVLKVDESCSP
jgi:hypothetical protein